MGLLVECVVVPPFMENAYVVGDEESGEALIVDPGGGVEQLARLLDRRKLTPVAIANTHAHIDHVGGVAEARRRFAIPFLLHEGDRTLLESLPIQATAFGFPPVAPPEVDRWLVDGGELRLGAVIGRVVHTPGHSPGGCCFYFPEARVLLTGDTLFEGSIGRTDLPGGSARQLIASIRDRLFPLGDEVAFYPGHGAGGTLGRERRLNPFVGESARG